MAKLNPALIPPEAKALALGRFHLRALARQWDIIRVVRGRRDIRRALEGFWIVLEALVAHFEARTLTQKDLTARAEGTSSAATISRAIGDIEQEGWIRTIPTPGDHRVRTIQVTEQALGLYLMRVDSGWDDFWSIAEAALTAGGLETRPTVTGHDYVIGC